MPTQAQLNNAKDLIAAFIRRSVNKPWSVNQDALTPPVVYEPGGEDRWRMFMTGKYPPVVGLVPNTGVAPSSQKKTDSEGLEYDQVLLRGDYQFFHLNRKRHAHLGSSEIEFGDNLPNYYYQRFETTVDLRDPDSVYLIGITSPGGRAIFGYRNHHTINFINEVRWGGTDYADGGSEAFIWYESLASAGEMTVVWLPDRILLPNAPLTLLWRLRCREEDLGPKVFWAWNEFAMLDLNWIGGYILRELGTGADTSDGIKTINAAQEFLKTQHDLYEQPFGVLRKEFFETAPHGIETWWPITARMFWENDLWPDTIRNSQDLNIFAWSPHISRAAGLANRVAYAKLGFPWSLNSKTQAAAAALMAYGDAKPWWAHPETGTGIEICRLFLEECLKGETTDLRHTLEVGPANADDAVNRIWRVAAFACPEESPYYSDWVVRFITVGCLYWRYCQFTGDTTAMAWIKVRVDYWVDQLLALQFDWNGKTTGDDGDGVIREYYSPWCAGGMPGRFAIDGSGNPYVVHENTICNQAIEKILFFTSGPDEQHVDQWFLTEHPEASLEWYHALKVYEASIFSR